MSKIVLVGQARNPRGGSFEPLDGASGRRLSALAGMDHAAFLERFERVNLLEEGEPGKPFDVRAARERADVLREQWQGRKAVLLGRGVAAAFRLVSDDYQWFKPIEIPPGLEVVVMPHPSGISRWWNEADNVASAREFMLQLKLGYLDKPRKRDPREQFTVDQVAAALEVGRGVYSWAAEALAEATGRSCVPQTIKNYVERYPDRLSAVAKTAQAKIFGTAARNVVRAVEAGDLDSSKWMLTTRRAHDLADEVGYKFERVITAKHEGTVEHKHEVVVQLQEATRRLIDVTNQADVVALPRTRSG